MSQLQQKKPLISDCPVIDWIDRELTDVYTLDFALEEKSNILLELRHLFCEEATRGFPNRLVGQFYQLLPVLEANYYLLGFRIRQWFALHYTIKLSDPLQHATTEFVEICQTRKSLNDLRKYYFEASDYKVAFGDIKIEILAK